MTVPVASLHTSRRLTGCFEHGSALHDIVVQPYLRDDSSTVKEVSTILFGGEVSHSVLKSYTTSDFRTYTYSWYKLSLLEEQRLEDLCAKLEAKLVRCPWMQDTLLLLTRLWNPNTHYDIVL